MNQFSVSILISSLLFSTGWHAPDSFRPLSANYIAESDSSHEKSVSARELRECLACDELRWAAICEYYGRLTQHYPADKVGGSTGMVIIKGKNCTPHGPGTASAQLTEVDGKTYSFSHAHHRSCENASALFHNAQYYLLFSPEGKKNEEAVCQRDPGITQAQS